MSDPTTEGLEATPEEIEGMVRNLCAYALGEPDPIQRYEGLTHQQVLFQGMIEAIRRERGRLVADLIVDGLSVTEVAEQTSLRAVVKVRKLISVAGQTQRVQEATAARKLAERKAAKASTATGTATATGTGTATGTATATATGTATATSTDTATSTGTGTSGSGRAGDVRRKGGKAKETSAPPQITQATPQSTGATAETPSGVPALPAHLAAPTGKRLLTAADRLALGLPA